MRITVNGGHTPTSPGAGKYLDEVRCDRAVKDALIAEGGVPGEDTGYAVSYLYEMDEEGNVTFEEEPAYVGEAPNFMIALNDADSYSEEDIDEKYLEEDAVDDEE